jgi:TonB family protein
MPLIQIPLEPPPAEPPHRRDPNQGDLFDSTSWESAYKELHDFPTLLIQTRDELSRSRKREAFWISLVAHLVFILIAVNSDTLSNYFAKYLPHRNVVLVKTRDNDKLTFLQAPPDLQKVQPPKTNQMSDKNRVAMSRAPRVNQQELKKILDASRQGRPGPQASQPAPQAQAAAPQQAQAEAQQPPAQQPQPADSQMAKMQTPPLQRKPTPSFDTQPMSASRSIAQAAQQTTANHRSYGGDGGDLGLGQRQPTARMGPMEILTDTQGVDFGPYLARVLHDLKENWYHVLPASVLPPLYKKGKVSIDFAIGKNGQVEGIRYVSSSGDVALDRAAYGGITGSNPFQPLPKEFSGEYLGLRIHFLYNPDPNEADLQ